MAAIYKGMVLIMINYLTEENTLASFETEKAMLKIFPKGLKEAAQKDIDNIHNKEKTVLEKIRDLESSITEQNKQEAILGDEYAISVIQSIRDQISELRADL